MKRFPGDQGIYKIALEYHLAHDLALAEKIIADYTQKFPKQQADMLKYRIILCTRQKKFDEVSRLFRQNFSPELAGAYWDFAIHENRLEDLRILAGDPRYKPYCQAAILLAQGKKEDGLNILARTGAGNDLKLLFYAAKTLAENDRLQDALQLYKKFPANSAYQLDVLLNSAELYSALGNLPEAVRLAREAYKTAPGSAAVQYCLADKLYKSGDPAEIADIVKYSKSLPFHDQLRVFLTASLEFNLKNCALPQDKDRALNFSERLLRLDPDNKIAPVYLQKIHSMRKKE